MTATLIFGDFQSNQAAQAFSGQTRSIPSILATVTSGTVTITSQIKQTQQQTYTVEVEATVQASPAVIAVAKAALKSSQAVTTISQALTSASVTLPQGISLKSVSVASSGPSPSPSPGPGPAPSVSKTTATLNFGGFTTCQAAAQFSSNTGNVSSGLATKFGLPAGGVTTTASVNPPCNPRRLEASPRRLTQTWAVQLIATFQGDSTAMQQAAAVLNAGNAAAVIQQALSNAGVTLPAGVSLSQVSAQVQHISGPNPSQNVDAAVGSQAAPALFLALFVRFLW